MMGVDLAFEILGIVAGIWLLAGIICNLFILHRGSFRHGVHWPSVALLFTAGTILTPAYLLERGARLTKRRIKKWIF